MTIPNLPNERFLNIFFAPDGGGGDGGAGGGGTSLIDGTPPSAPEGGQDTPPANDPTPRADDGRMDPFGDLVEYKDPETGLYFGRYKNITEAFKGLKEAQNELGRLKREKSPELPEKYEPVTFDETVPEPLRGAKVDESDPMFQHFVEKVFRPGKFTQEQVALLVKENALYNLGLAPDLKAERVKLGAEADTIIGAVNTYVSKRNTDGMKLLGELAGTNADALKELHILISQAGEKPIPGKLGDGVPAKTPAVMKQEAFDYKEQHRKQIDGGSRFHIQQYEDMLKAAVRAEKAQKAAG